MEFQQRDQADRLLCPIAQPEMANAQVLGVLEETKHGPLLTYLNQRVPVTDDVLRMAEPARPTAVFRFAAICEQRKCLHFDGTDCHLARRIVQILPAAVSSLPPCIIRANCRWYAQEGGQVACAAPKWLP